MRHTCEPVPLPDIDIACGIVGLSSLKHNNIVIPLDQYEASIAGEVDLQHKSCFIVEIPMPKLNITLKIDHLVTRAGSYSNT